MKSQRPVKRPRLSLWLCLELVWEFCSAIPIVNTWERILLTSTNIHTYLGPRFRKMLIYRDAIAFLKANLNANKNIEIEIDEMAQNKESGPIVVKQEQSEDKFVLKTNHFTFRINDDNWCQGGCIDSIGLSPKQFNSTLADEALGKYNKLKIYAYDPVNAAKLVHWLTTPNTNSNIGQPKKYLALMSRFCNATPFLDEMKKDFVRATSKRRFFVCIKLCQPFGEFILCNELTGEKLELQLRLKNEKYFIYGLSRFPNNEMKNIEGDFAEFDPDRMTTIFL